jgi:predicted nucleic acid-binding protein
VTPAEGIRADPATAASIPTIRDVTEPMAREAARPRTATGRAGTISASDAIVAGFAAAHPTPMVLTSDPADLTALAEHAALPIAVMPT